VVARAGFHDILTLQLLNFSLVLLWGRMRGISDASLLLLPAVHPGFVQTGLGMETNPDFSDAKAFAATKAGWGAISLAEGTDTLLWTIAAADGVVQSGKLYHQRKVHSF
jgi:hypothetical protein